MTAEQLIATVRQRANLPATTKVSDQSILDDANGELIELQQDALRSNAELLTAQEDVPLVTGIASYTFPTRAIAAAARVVTFVDANGRESEPLDQEELANIHAHSTSPGVPRAFYLLGDGQIVLLPPPVDGKLRFRYPRRLSKLVLAAQVGSVLSVDTATQLTLQAAGAFLVGQLADITAAKSPHKLTAKDVNIVGVAGAVVTVSGVDLTKLGIVKGDLVTLATFSSIPHLPTEWHTLLALRTARAVQARQKDYKALADVAQQAKTVEGKVIDQGSPRVAQNPRRISAWRGLRRRW